MDCSNPRSNPRCGFTRIRCPDCGEERLLMFSCWTRGFCPSCHAKRHEEWGEWMRETLLLDIPHRQVVFTIPKMLRVFFKFKRKLLGDLCRCAVRALLLYFQAMAGTILEPGIVAVIQTFGDRISFHPHLHLLVTEGGMDEAGLFHFDFFPRSGISFFRERRNNSYPQRDMIADNMEKEITIPHRPRQALKPTSRNLASALGLLVGILAVILCLARGAQKTYWHFTIKAAIVPEQAVEWAWVTFVQMDKAEAFPDTAEMVRRMGGEFIGTNLGQVRAAAWRSSYSYTKDRRCNDRPSKIEISWTESWSDQVLAHCQITDTIHREELFAFKFGFCARRARVLMEDGQRRGLDDLENLIIGPIYMGRGEREAMLGKFRTEAINYEDAQTHYKFCGKSWVEQHNSILLHYTHDGLRGAFVDSLWDTEGVDAFGFQGHDILVYFTIIRNNSREHPFWKQRYLIR